MIFGLLRNVNMSGFNLQFKSRAGISSTCTYIIHITEAKFQTSMEFIDEKITFSSWLSGWDPCGRWACYNFPSTSY